VVLTSESGVIMSPGYDVSQYPAMMTCTWTLVPTSGKSLHINFSDFNTEQDMDFLEVRKISPII